MMEDDSVHDVYEQRLMNIRKAIDGFNPTVQQIEENLRFIDENKDKIRQLSLKVPGATYIELHHSKHEEFIKLMKKLHDINKNLDQYKLARENQTLDLPRLKEFLNQQETVFRDNIRAVTELEYCINKLDSLVEISNASTTTGV